MSEQPGHKTEKPKENKGVLGWLRTVWDKMMHDGRGDADGVRLRVKRIKNKIKESLDIADDRTMSSDELPEGTPEPVVRSLRSRRKKKHLMKNMVSAGRELKERRRDIIELERKPPERKPHQIEPHEIERKPQDFPFSRYFLGGGVPEEPKLRINWREWKNDEITAGWIGHSTVLVNFFGKWIITDPVFSDKTGYDLTLIIVGPTRLVKAALLPEDLPIIDIVMMSHAHMDHTDKPSLRKIRNARHLVCPVNTSDIFQNLGMQDVQEIEWGDRVTFPDYNVTVEAIEVKHFGWRYPWEPCRGRNEEGGRSFNAFTIEGLDPSGKLRTVVFAGDTAYTESFKVYGDRLRAEGRIVDLAIMPIGAYEPWIAAHCNPAQAWQMTEEMGAENILPVHWNTFIQSAEPRFEPIEWLMSEVDDESKVVIKEIGGTWSTK